MKLEKHKDLASDSDKSIQSIEFSHSTVNSMDAQEHKGSSVINNYDVFFSFSFQDFHTMNYLYSALSSAGFRIIRDGDVIERSSDFDSDVKNLIDLSKISVVLLSKNYVSSRWCLDQLVTIIKSKKNLILPVFYDMDPFKVSSENERMFEDQLNAESDTGIRNSLMNKMKEWSNALWFAANVPGFILPKAQEKESSLINGFIKAVTGIASLQKEAKNPLFKKLKEKDLSRLAEDWTAEEIRKSNIEKLPKNPYYPYLVKLLFQGSNDLTKIPDHFFKFMPRLQVLDLSNTSIKSLPQSLASLGKLQELYARDCVLLTELPPEIGELSNLEVFDLEGTELGYFPKESGRLLKLKSLKFSLSRHADKYIERKGIEAIIPKGTLSKFHELKELSILVDPDCEWWDAEVETVIDELYRLRKVTNLKLYFPTLALLEKLSSLYFRLTNFTLTVGRHESQIISSVPRELQTTFQKKAKCLIYVNGRGNSDGIDYPLNWSRALFLDRQWTMKKLTELSVDSLEICLVVECNEMNTIVDGNDFISSTDTNKKHVLRCLRYLSVHYMKNLQSIWRGPIISPTDFCSLEIIALHTCPELTMIFDFALLSNLVLLKELIVENCAKVKSLVSADVPGLEAISGLLPVLKKILLVDLPELVSIFGGLPVGPRLESIFFYNCPKLKNLSPEESMYDECMQEIKDDDGSGSFNELETTNREIDYLRELIDEEVLDLDMDLDLDLNLNREQIIDGANHQLMFASAKRIILQWDTSASNDARDAMIFNSDRQEVSLYLQAVDVIQQYMGLRMIRDKMLDENFSEAYTMIHIAMARLGEEFRNILVTRTSSKANKYYATGHFINDTENYFRESAATSRSHISSYTSSNAIRALDLMAREDINVLQSIAKRMIYATYIHECVQVYRSARESAVALTFRKLMVDNIGDVKVQMLEWKVLDKKIGGWIRAAKVCVRVLFAGEKKLCEEIFKGLGTTTTDDDYFVETIIGPANQLLNFAEALDFTPLKPEKLFKILDLHDALSDLMPDINYLFGSRSLVSTRVQKIRSRLAESSREILTEFGHLVLREAFKNLVPGGSIQPVNTYVMNYITALSDYKQTLAELIVSKPETSSSTLDMSSSSHEDQQSNYLALHFTWFINCLRSTLDEKSKYVDASLSHLYIMNNVHHMVQKIKGCPKLREIIGETYLSTLIVEYKEAVTGYLKSSWARILSCLCDESGGSMKSGQVSKSDLRKRLESFNAMFNEVHHTQFAWSVPDTRLREEILISISEKLIPSYESFLDLYKRYVEIEKHKEDYDIVKYSVSGLERALLKLFMGLMPGQHAMATQKHKT